jgi:hypothetical protein
MHPPIVARQRLGEHVLEATNTRNNRRIVGLVVFYAARVVWKESLWVCLCIPVSFLGNGSVDTFPRQRRIVEGVVFYAVRVVSKERRWYILPRTSCIQWDRSSWLREGDTVVGKGQQQYYWTEAVQVTNTDDRPDLSSEGAPDIDKTGNVKQKLITGHEPQMGLDTKTDWSTDRRS